MSVDSSGRRVRVTYPVTPPGDDDDRANAEHLTSSPRGELTERGSYSARGENVDFDRLSDEELVTAVMRLATSEREATSTLVRSLMEVDARRLYLRDGCSSLFAWCTEVVGLGEGAAYNRIEVARAGRRVPQLVDALEDGSLTLAAARVLAPHVTPANCADVIGQARHKSKREVERLVAALHPLPDAGWAFTHLSPGRVRLHVTISEATYDKLRRAQELLRHTMPEGDIEQILERAVTLLIADLERRRFAATEAPRGPRAARATSRHVPAAVRRAVWTRDGGQCAFVGGQSRCSARGFLEFHHRQPYAAGGATTADNLELRCRQHNQFEATLYFGENGADTVRELASSY
ncbi:MAG: HNH endonuclease [Acidobacteria bacterium]|nr:HNH endonuclease [Acidobacteriota bacterium]